jgi:hypothetical protein
VVILFVTVFNIIKLYYNLPRESMYLLQRDLITKNGLSTIYLKLGGFHKREGSVYCVVGNQSVSITYVYLRWSNLNNRIQTRKKMRRRIIVKIQLSNQIDLVKTNCSKRKALNFLSG